LLIAAGQEGVTTARFGRTLLYVVLYNSVISWLIRTAWKDARSDEDDEELWTTKRFLLAMSTEWASGIPIFGDTLEAVAYKQAGVWMPEGNLFNSIPRSANAWERLLTLEVMDRSTKENVRDLEMISSSLAIGSDSLAAAASFSHLLRDVADLADNAGLIDTD
jgi:hypothetical protein